MDKNLINALDLLASVVAAQLNAGMFDGLSEVTLTLIQQAVDNVEDARGKPAPIKVAPPKQPEAIRLSVWRRPREFFHETPSVVLLGEEETPFEKKGVWHRIGTVTLPLDWVPGR